MPILHIFILAIIQGITEFLPVSSSGHLILLPELAGIPDQGLMMDVAVHVGTLVAVIVYFRREVAMALQGMGQLVKGQHSSASARLALGLIIATIPVVIAGFVIKTTGMVEGLRSATVIGWSTLIFGILLYVSDQTGRTVKVSRDWTSRDALLMGMAQALALIPGTSRSGITITAARQLGYTREDAARLAMLMSIPTIAASGVLLAGEAVSEANIALLRDAALAAAFACVAALAALWFMMRLLQSVSFTPYVIYRIVLGVGLLLWAYV